MIFTNLPNCPECTILKLSFSPSIHGLPLDHGVSPTQTTFCFVWINFMITKYATPLQDSVKHFCFFLCFFCFYFFFTLCLVLFCFCSFGGLFCFVFSQLTVFPFEKVVLFAAHPNTSYMSPTHNNFDVVNYFLYKCGFLCIFQSSVLLVFL